MTDHARGLQHSTVLFYLHPNRNIRCQNCSQLWACVKIVDITDGSVTEDALLCQLCYLSHVNLLSRALYGSLSTECVKLLLISCGCPVDDCAKQGESVPDSTGYSLFPHFPPQDFLARIVTDSDVRSDVSHKSTAPTTTTIYVSIKNFFTRSRRSRTAKGRT